MRESTVSNIFGIIALGEINLELLDSVGERKYIKAKLTQQANEFLTDKLSYRLARTMPDPAGICLRDVFSVI